MVLVVKNPPANTGDIRDLGSITGLGRPPGGGHSSPPQYACLESTMDRGAWQALVHQVAQCRTRLKQLSVHAWCPYKRGNLDTGTASHRGEMMWCHTRKDKHMIWVMCSKARECPGLAENRQARTWDSLLQCCRLAPGQTSPPATKYQETIRYLKKCMHAHLGQIMAKKCKRPKISTTTSEELGAKTGCWEQKAGYHAWPLHTASPKGWTNQLGHPSIPLDTPLLSPHLRKKLALPSVSKQRGSLLFALPPAVAGARIKPRFSFLFGL